MHPRKAACPWALCRWLKAILLPPLISVLLPSSLKTSEVCMPAGHGDRNPGRLHDRLPRLHLVLAQGRGARSRRRKGRLQEVRLGREQRRQTRETGSVWLDARHAGLVNLPAARSRSSIEAAGHSPRTYSCGWNPSARVGVAWPRIAIETALSLSLSTHMFAEHARAWRWG